MFFLHASNKTEHLLQHLATLINVDQRRNIFEKEIILIQSQGMERMISQYMADAFTSWCNFQYLLPLTFLKVIAEKLGMEIMPDSFDRTVLCWRIEDKLHRIDEDVYKPIQQYLRGYNTGLKRYQLSSQLANIFDQYQLMRPQMLKGWEKGIVYTGDPAEFWQMHLWNRLIAEEDLGQHRGALLQKVIARLQKEELSSSLPHRVSIFGLHIMPPLFLDYLNAMSKHCDVHLFLLSPCKEYWGDMTNKRSAYKERISRREKGLPIDELPDKYHPLLASLGEQGRVFQEMLLKNVTFEQEITSYQEPFFHENPTLLHRLQSDILAGGHPEKPLKFTDDDSIKVVSCHSRQRELAVLKDHILNILDRDHELQLRDIVVMAPDIQEYAAFVPAVFEDIQHSIADRSLHRRNVYTSIFSEFLTLFSGRFGWAEVLDLLQKEQVYPNFGLTYSDIEQLQHWVVTTGIRWGLSGKTRESAGFNFSENSWRNGLNRLLMGYMIDTDQQIEGVLPYGEIEGGGAIIVGGLCEFIDLIERASQDFKHDNDLKEWSTLLLDYATRLYGSEDERNLLEFRTVLLELANYGLLHSLKIEFEVIRKWFEHTSSEARSASGFLRGQLTFCSMLPMRSIPFKAVCIIGMNYGAFPKVDRQATFDLMAAKPKPGDRSLRADDRYQFLEALLSTRESLYISYVGQSLQNNETIPPSVVVTELLETLKNGYGKDDVTVTHPLHPFSSRYFSDTDKYLFSYSEENFRIASKLHTKKDGLQQWWHGRIEEEIESIDVADLLSFYRNPQLYFVQRCLGVRLSEESTLPEESESFVVEGLDSFIINQEILEKSLKGEDLESFHRQLSEEGRWPLGIPGALTFSQRSEEILRFADIIKEQQMGLRMVDADIDVLIGKYRLKGKLSNIYEGGVLIVKYADLKGSDLLSGWIHHLVGIAIGGIKPVTKLVMKDRMVCFDCLDNLRPQLEELIDHYVEGCSRPSMLYVEPAFQYCQQKMSKNARILPLHKAEMKLRTSIENGYEPSWSMLNSNLDETMILDEAFEALCEQMMMPLWSVNHGG